MFFQIEIERKKEKERKERSYKKYTNKKNNNTPQCDQCTLYILSCLSPHMNMRIRLYRTDHTHYYRDLSYNKSLNNHMTYELIKMHKHSTLSFTQTLKRKRTHSHRGTLCVHSIRIFILELCSQFDTPISFAFGFFSSLFFCFVPKENLTRDQVSISCFAYVHLCSRARCFSLIYLFSVPVARSLSCYYQHTLALSFALCHLFSLIEPVRKKNTRFFLSAYFFETSKFFFFQRPIFFLLYLQICFIVFLASLCLHNNRANIKCFQCECEDDAQIKNFCMNFYTYVRTRRSCHFGWPQDRSSPSIC